MGKRKTLYIISHSSMDIVSVLSLYERYRHEHEVNILISSTAENLHFLQFAKIPPATLRLIRFESRYNENKKNVMKFIRQLRSEKKQLDQIVREINADTDNELIFHSYDTDFQMGYLAVQVAKTNRVTLADVLGIERQPLRVRDLLTRTGIKNTIYLAVISLVFGRHFMLSGNRSYPIISLDRRLIDVETVPRNSFCLARKLSEYKYCITTQGVNIIFNYCDAHGTSEETHLAINRELIGCLAGGKFNIFVKLHPQSSPPDFFNEFELNFIPKFIPFELIDLANVSLVIGIEGASLLCTGSVPTVSFVKMVYGEGSDYYASAMSRLARNRAIRFISSVDELKSVIRNVE